MRWFLVAGAVGLTVAVVLAIWNVHGMVTPTVLFVLWPTSIVGMANTGPFKLTIRITDHRDHVRGQLPPIRPSWICGQMLSDMHFSNAFVVRSNPALDLMNVDVGIVYHLGGPGSSR